MPFALRERSENRRARGGENGELASALCGSAASAAGMEYLGGQKEGILEADGSGPYLARLAYLYSRRSAWEPEEARKNAERSRRRESEGRDVHNANRGGIVTEESNE